MRRRESLIWISVAMAVLAVVLLPKANPIRSWRITQTKTIADGISMRVEDVYVYPTGTNRLLRVRCRWLGGNPNERYAVRASIRTSAESTEIDPKFGCQVGVPDDGRSGIPMIWEFWSAPEGTTQFFLRIYTREKAKDDKERFVDFRIPYLPKVTPHGEIEI